MSNPDPRLQKLVEGAQRHVRSPGSMSAADRAMLSALNNYEEWRAEHLAEPEDKEAPDSEEPGASGKSDV